MSNVPRVHLVLILCTAIAVLAGCGKDDNAQANAAPPPTPVTVIRVEQQRVPLSLDAVGQAEGSREVEIRARVSGILEKRTYNEGDRVKAGAVLFRIDPAPYEIALRQARASLGQEQAREEQAQRDVARLKELAEQRAIGQREYEQAVSTFKQSTAAISGAQATIAETQLNLSYTTVTAPISGITGRALHSEGSLVTANTDSGLLTTLTQVDPIWVRFSLPETEFDRIRGAQKNAEVRLLNADRSVAASKGRLNFAASTVDTSLGTVQLRAEFRNADLNWLPGQFARVQILAGEQQAFLVPQLAVIQNEQGHGVWVVGADNKVSLRPVQTANWIGSDWVISSGLKQGEQVVIDNIIKLRPGATVQPQLAGTAPTTTPAVSTTTPAAASPTAPQAR